MKTKILLVILTFLILQTGCARSLRFTHEEIKDFSPTVQEHIKNNEIAVGMTKIQVRYSWGGPAVINVLPPGEGGKERVEWIYKRLHVFSTRLIFTDDKLTEIISSEPGILK